jgi:hypothetical protein
VWKHAVSIFRVEVVMLGIGDVCIRSEEGQPALNGVTTQKKNVDILNAVRT